MAFLIHAKQSSGCELQSRVQYDSKQQNSSSRGAYILIKKGKRRAVRLIYSVP